MPRPTPATSSNRCSASIELHPLLSLDRQDAAQTPSAPSSYNAQAFMPEAFVISLWCAACDRDSQMVATSAASCCCFVRLRCRLLSTQDQRLHRRSPTRPNRDDPGDRIRQVPGQRGPPSLSSAISEFAKYHYARRPRTRQVPLREQTCATTSTTVAEDPCNGTVKFDYLRVYHYFPRRF